VGSSRMVRLLVGVDSLSSKAAVAFALAFDLESRRRSFVQQPCSPRVVNPFESPRSANAGAQREARSVGVRGDIPGAGAGGAARVLEECIAFFEKSSAFLVVSAL